jgi:hypothetical protein
MSNEPPARAWIGIDSGRSIVLVLDPSREIEDEDEDD